MNTPAASPVAPPGVLAVVALGSNIGDRGGTIRRAVEDLRHLSAGGFRASTILETAAVDCPPGSPDFLNAVVVFAPRPGESPESLLTHLQEIERKAGRPPKRVLNEPRPLDLDLIAFGDAVRNTPVLVLPHPRAHQRAFVLAPLAEIVPHFRAPGWPAAAGDLLRGLAG